MQASKHVKKEEQMKDYEKNFGLTSLNYSKMYPMSCNSASSLNKTGDSHSPSEFGTKRSNFRSSNNNSRCSSAKSNVSKMSQAGLSRSHHLDANEFLRRASSSQRRPQWEERWWSLYSLIFFKSVYKHLILISSRKKLITIEFTT